MWSNFQFVLEIKGKYADTAASNFKSEISTDMWSDRESAKDFLNFTELADQIGALAMTKDMLPLSIGVFGTWGTGKSTVLRLVRGKLEGEVATPVHRLRCLALSGL